jgi:hypothetical protein
MNMMPLLVSWAALASVVLVLAIYRKVVARKEDDFLHVDSPVIAQQQAIAKKLEVIDKWGKLLTIIAAVYSLVVVSAFLYNGWIDSGRIQ